MRRDTCETAGDSAVYIFHHAEIGWEQDVEVALHHQRSLYEDCTSLVPRLYDRRVEASRCLRQSVKIRSNQSVGWEARAKDGEELHQSSGDVFWYGQVWCERETMPEGSP